MLLSTSASEPTSIDVTSETLDAATEAASDQPLIQVRPYLETDGIEAGPRFLRGLHTSPATTIRRRGAPVYAFEIWFADGKLQFYLRAPDPQDAIDLVNAHYPDSGTQEAGIGGFSDVNPGDCVAGCHLQPRLDAAFPLKHLDTRPTLDDDPFRTVFSRLTGTDAETTVLQVVFMPIDQAWTRRGLVGQLGSSDVGRLAQAKREGSVSGYFDPEVVQTKHDKRAADDIAAQKGRPAFATTIRALALGPEASTVEHRLERIAGAFSPLDHEHTTQRLVPTFASHRHVSAVVEAAGMRVLTQRHGTRRLVLGRQNVLTANELAGLVHFPNDDLENPDVDWSRMSSGAGVPPQSPQFADTTGFDLTEKASDSEMRSR